MLGSGARLVDVRSRVEHEVTPIPGAVNLPLDELRDRLAELPPGPLVVHCEVGVRGHTAVQLLRGLGREAHNLDGGYQTWQAGVRATSS